MHIAVRNASHALSEGLSIVTRYGEERGSRNGPVKAMDEPITITYLNPAERVIFFAERDANPFFHLFECLWMLAGRRDVKGVAQFVPGMRNYSDDGRRFNAAYGYRWRKHFQVDQLEWIVERLSQPGANEDRRCFVGMWSPSADTKPSLDLPCNVGVAFRVRSNGRLDMTVFNRSNDLVLGMAGANVVHMSFLHEVIALASGWTVGNYHQISNDLHMYMENEATQRCLPLAGTWSEGQDAYAQGWVAPYPVMETDWKTWQQDLHTFLLYGNVVGLRDRFFRRVCGPMMAAHKHYRDHKGEGRYLGAIEIIEQCIASDWRTAGREWLQRRLDKLRMGGN